MSWTPRLQLDRAADGAVYLRIATALQDDVRAGVLRRGDRLPGTRAVARRLGVHRNTVLAAWQELESQGWIASRPSSGTFVTADLPPLPAPGPLDQRTGAAGFRVDTPAEVSTYGDVPPGALGLLAGKPDLRLVPGDLLGRAWRRVLASPRRAREVLSYGDPRGLPVLRRELTTMLAARRGVAADEDGIVVTRGAQHALYLAGQALVRAGDTVLVEEMGFPPAWAALGSTGAKLVAMPVDEGGLSVRALASWIEEHGPPRAIYVTPHHQYPTMTTLGPGRRARLLELAAEHRFAVIEDDYDNEFHFDGQPVRPLAASDPAGVVVYIGTLSKVLAPGLRMGYVVAAPPVIEAIARVRRVVDRQGDRISEAAMAELLADGTVLRHIRRVRRVYGKRRQVLADALTERLGDVLMPDPPPGGLAFWVRVLDDTIDIEAWQRRCQEQEVVFRVGKELHFRGEDPRHLRLGYAALDEDELVEAVRRMRLAL
jgi:GntR family transcriptional regulator / MocR family aminotransferase